MLTLYYVLSICYDIETIERYYKKEVNLVLSTSEGGDMDKLRSVIVI